MVRIGESSYRSVDMKSLTGSCFLAVLLSGLLSSAQAINKETYVPFGGSMKLTPPEEIKDLTSILWKFNNNLVTEWVKDIIPLEYYPKYQGRSTLDEVTGNLTITKLTQDDTGVYTVETNNRVQNDGYDVKVVKNVVKPQVEIKPLVCDSTSTSCSLTCEGDTTETGPITYSWKMGDEDWTEMEKDVPITNDDETKKVQTFSCRMKNLFSEAESDPINNPFNQEETPGTPVGAVAGGVLTAVAAVVAGVFGFLKREPIKQFFGSNGTDVERPAQDENREDSHEMLSKKGENNVSRN